MNEGGDMNERHSPNLEAKREQIIPQRLPILVQRLIASVSEEEKLIDQLCRAVLSEQWTDAQALAGQLAVRRALPAGQQAEL